MEKKILVVDDEHDILNMLTGYLEEEGFDVNTASNGREAIKSFQSDPVPVVVTDMRMPGMDGLAVMRRVKELDEDVEVIILTAYAALDNVIEAFQYNQGAFDYLTKPLEDIGQLAIAIEKARESRRLRIENKSLVEQLKQAKANLEKRVEERTLELQEANQRLLHELDQRKRAEEALAEARTRELEIGAKIQETLLLRAPPHDVQGLAISALTIPSQRIDGDFYDFFKHSDRIMDFIIGDVMGKGVPAALLGAGAKTQFLRSLNYLISTSDELPSPEAIVQHVHHALVKEFIGLEVFMTLCYARFDLNLKKLFFVDCGHTKTIHSHPENGVLNLLEGFNLPFGCDEEEVYRQVETEFQPGDVFFFYSDGITEARSGLEDFFGLERLMECVRTHSHLSPEAMIDTVRNAVIRFSSSESFSDDLTCAAIIIEKDGSAEPIIQLEMEVTSDMANLEAIRNMVQRTHKEAKISDLDEEWVWQMELVLNEAAANIIKHAYHLRKDGRIKIESEVFMDKLVFCLHHWGDDFERESIPFPPFDGEQESGYGLFIIDSYTDDVMYSTDENGRKSICLIKNRG